MSTEVLHPDQFQQLEMLRPGPSGPMEVPTSYTALGGSDLNLTQDERTNLVNEMSRD